MLLNTKYRGGPDLRWPSLLAALTLSFSSFATELVNAGPPREKELAAQVVKANPGHQGNDFKRMFGHHIRMGMGGILEDIQPGDLLPPDPTYPPPLGNNAIIFYGTEYARAALSDSVQTTNLQPLPVALPIRALAETDQMDQIRDTYGERIWLPSVIESSKGVERVIRFTESNEFALENDLDPLKVNLVAFNGNQMVVALLYKDIWENNRADHVFYVEEGYAQKWMSPYLEPHGLVMRLAPDKRPIPSELLQKDAAFWDWYSARLLEHPRFAHDAAARHAFSKLRVAMAGVFHERGLLAEAEKAYEQAHALCPSSMEVVFCRSNFFIATARVDKAVQLVLRQLEAHPDHAGLLETLQGMRELERLEVAGRKLEKEWEEMKVGDDTARLEKGFLLLKNVAQRSLGSKVDEVARRMSADPCLTGENRMRLFRELEQHRRFHTHRELALAALDQNPGNVPLHLEVAAAHLRFDAKREAIEVILAASRQDARETHRLMASDYRFDLFLMKEPYVAKTLERKAESLETNAP